MKRLKDDFLDIVNAEVKVQNKDLLEVGCGIGARSKLIAQKCKSLIAIDPNNDSIKTAKKMNAGDNIKYQIGTAEKLNFTSNAFDTVIFTLSFHHVPFPQMTSAIKEAVRVTKQKGHIVFLEPTHIGTFFESELQFDACDGDERKEKAYAYYTMLDCADLIEVKEIFDETILQFDSYKDFLEVMKPKKNLNQLKSFLEEHHYVLHAKRRINIFWAKK